MHIQKILKMVNFEMSRRYHFQSIMNIHRVLFILLNSTKWWRYYISNYFESRKALIRLQVVPHFSSGIVERAKHECAWKSPHARKARSGGEREKWFKFFSLSVTCHLFSHGVIFTRARVSLALLSPRTNEGLLVVYKAFCILINSGSTLLTL